MKRRLFSIAMALVLASSIQAQELSSYITDGFNFSQLGLYGTASYVGRAGAIGALGGDFTSASYNPAGLGLFYNSRISITPALDWNSNKSIYMNTSSNSNHTSFNIADLEVLLAVPTGKENGWKSAQFGIGLNRLKDFNRETFVEGGLTSNSLVDVWVDEANNNRELDAYTTQLAYNTYLLDTLSGGNTYYNNFSGRTNQLYQSYQSVESGGVSEMTFSLSGNYEDKFYVGGTIGIPFLSFHRTKTYHELANVTEEFFDFVEDLDVTGIGVNLKIGGIYRPVEMLRLGFAFHTPTYYDLDEVYATSLSNSEYRLTSNSPEGNYIYSLCTPLKVLGSVGLTFGSMGSAVAGSIDFDYEFTNYQGLTFAHNSECDDLEYKQWRTKLNKTIDETYQAAHTFRVGGTINIRHIALRAGWMYSTNPYQETTNLNGESSAITCGLGYSNSNYFVDFAYAHITQKDRISLVYSDAIVSSTPKNNVFLLTIGFKF